MTTRRLIRTLACLALAGIPVVLFAQNTTPHVISTPGDVTAALGSSTVVNHGLVGVGRISASSLDSFGETFGSVSGLQITNWSRSADGTYGGILNILPDRGFNSGSFFSDYAARIIQIGFRFAPHARAATIGGSSDAEKIAAQNQIAFTTAVTGAALVYDDPVRHTSSVTTGLDPGANYVTLFGSLRTGDGLLRSAVVSGQRPLAAQAVAAGVSAVAILARSVLNLNVTGSRTLR